MSSGRSLALTTRVVKPIVGQTRCSTGIQIARFSDDACVRAGQFDAGPPEPTARTVRPAPRPRVACQRRGFLTLVWFGAATARSQAGWHHLREGRAVGSPGVPERSRRESVRRRATNRYRKQMLGPPDPWHVQIAGLRERGVRAPMGPRLRTTD